MKNELRISVTPEILGHAQIANSSHCLIAEAIKRWGVIHKQRIIRLGVDLQTIRFTDPVKQKRYIFLTPRAAQEAIIRFDQGIKSKPFRFSISTKRAAQVIDVKPRKRGKSKSKPTIKVRLHKERKTASAREVVIEGGTPPPVGALHDGGGVGARRMFGLKSLRLGKVTEEKAA